MYSVQFYLQRSTMFLSCQQIEATLNTIYRITIGCWLNLWIIYSFLNKSSLSYFNWLASGFEGPKIMWGICHHCFWVNHPLYLLTFVWKQYILQIDIPHISGCITKLTIKIWIFYYKYIFSICIEIDKSRKIQEKLINNIYHFSINQRKGKYKFTNGLYEIYNLNWIFQKLPKN